VIDLHSPNPPEETAETPTVFSVSELTRAIRALLEGAVGEVWVEGEISNYRRQHSGHQYFTLKDDACQLPCVLFRGDAAAANRERVPLADGVQVRLFGQVTVYEARGQYQLIVAFVQARGFGALQAKFEALKRALHAEGLFDSERKKPLPRFPRTVALVTSPTGAALQDMLNILRRRAPWLHVLVFPVRVQGRGAAAEIAGAIATLNLWKNADLIVLARGGGSIEDLWEFNEELLARAIAASVLPIVSAVGHEIDFTICDFVADLRAPTPSAAAELIAPDTAELRRRLEATGNFLRRQLGERLTQARENFRRLSRGALAREARRRLDAESQRLDDLHESLRRATTNALARLRADFATQSARLRAASPACQLEIWRQKLSALQCRFTDAADRDRADRWHRVGRAADALRLLGPQSTLERGYSITTLADGTLVTSTRQLTAGTEISTRLHDGVVRSKVN